MDQTRRRAEVMRLLDRYLVEVVERYELCPWARASREKDELGIDVLWGTPTVLEWITAANALLERPNTRVVMVVAPELVVTTSELRAVRAEVAAKIPKAGVAEFHPDATLDLATPARLVPFVRRSPDPMLQLVPLALLATVRTQPITAERVLQLQMLGSLAPAPKQDIAEVIAEANHKTVSGAQAEIVATLAEIAEDRRRSYQLAGISGTR